MLLNVLGLALAVVSIRSSERTGRRLLDAAGVRLSERLKLRLNRPELLTPAAVRSLALAVQQQTGCPAITDAMIARVVRGVALDAEERLRPTGRLVEKLTALDRLLGEIDARGPRLLSIAYSDRMRAYSLSMLSLGLGAFALQFWLTRFALTSRIGAIAIWVLPVVQLALVAQGLRASAYWNHKLRAAEDVPTISDEAPQRSPGRIDFFLRMASTNTMSPHLRWAPLWEDMLFGSIAISFAPILLAWLTFRIGEALGLTQSTLRSAIVFVVVTVGFGLLIWSSSLFANLHQLDYFRVRKLRLKVDLLERDIRVAQLGHKQLTEDMLDEYAGLCRELWLLSGDKRYQGSAARLANLRE